MQNQIKYNSITKSLDIRKFIFTILRKWYWFALSIGFCCLIAYLLNSYITPLYKISGTVLVNDERKSVAESLFSSLNRSIGRKNIENEISVLKSYNLTIKTLEQLHDFRISFYVVGKIRNSMLYKKAPFNVITDSSAFNKSGIPVNVILLSGSRCKIEIDGKNKISKILRYGETYVDTNFNFKIFLNDSKKFNPSVKHKYYFMFNNMIELVNIYKDKLDISPIDKKGTILKITSIGNVPLMEADYLNRLMEIYIREGTDEKKQNAIKTINFIDEQLSSALDTLHRSEDKLQVTRQTKRIIDYSADESIVFFHLQKLLDDKNKADMELRYYRYVQEYIDKKRDFSEMVAPVVLGIDNEMLNSRVTELAKMFGERNILAMKAQKDNPSLVMINAQIQYAINALQENIREIIYVKSIRLKEIEKQTAYLEDEMQFIPVAKRKLANLQHISNLNDDIYVFLLKKRADAATFINSNIAYNKILNVASGRHVLRIWPLHTRNYKIALLLGLFIPLSVFVSIEFFKYKILDINDIENFTNVPILGFVGHHEKMSDLPVVENPRSVIAESFRAIRTNLQFVMRDKEQKVISITSTISGEGKTFCAINLAAIIALGNKKTLLLSFDLRKPKIHQVFNLKNIVGISTYLIGKSEYEDIIFRTNIENLYVATAGPVPPNPAELLGTVQMEEFFIRVRKSFDIILIDTPPIALVTDAELLTRYSDYNIFVVRHNYSNKDVLKLVDDLYFKRGIKFGILVNDMKMTSSYGYGMKYSSYGYGNTKSNYYNDSFVNP